MHLEISGQLIAMVCTMIGTIGAVLYWFWSARAVRRENNAMLKDITESSERTATTLDEVAKTSRTTTRILERIESSLNAHEQENIEAHTKLITMLEKKS